MGQSPTARTSRVWSRTWPARTRRSAMDTWEPGRLVVRRQYHRGELLGRAWVGRVAADDDTGLWVWIANGSPYADVAAADGRSFREVPFGDWGVTPKVMRDKPWASDVLMLHP